MSDKAMKLVTSSKNTRVSCGILKDGRIIDIPSGWERNGAPGSVQGILKKGADYLEELKSLEKSMQNSKTRNSNKHNRKKTNQIL